MKERLKQAIVGIAYTKLKHRRDLPCLEKSLVPLLCVGSYVYRCLLFIRHKLYDWHFFSSVRLRVPVISVGNITWGGNGKTPMVEYLAHSFSEAGISPLILTRGYGGGDEVRLLQYHLSGTLAVICTGNDRASVASEFLKYHFPMSYDDIYRLATKFAACDYTKRTKQFPSFKSYTEVGSTNCRKNIGVILLDDGMQHWRISRDIDIVMVNALSHFGNEMLVPYGPLREELNALSRANIIVIHHASLVQGLATSMIELWNLMDIPNEEKHRFQHVACNIVASKCVSEEKVMDIRHQLEQFRGPLTPIICSEMVPRFFISVQNTQLDLEHLSNCLLQLVPLETVKNGVVLCVSGIGCPESLHLTVKHLGAAFIERVDFPDHHHFQAKDLVRVQRKARELHEKSHIHPIIVLTEKDYARNSEAFAGFEGLDLLVLHSTLEIKDSTDVKTFNSLIIQKIQEWCLGFPYKYNAHASCKTSRS